jgi:hypothetical protein
MIRKASAYQKKCRYPDSGVATYRHAIEQPAGAGQPQWDGHVQRNRPSLIDLGVFGGSPEGSQE